MKTAVKMEKNLTEGSILKTMLIFAVPMILGNLLQQVYNIADTMVVGRFLGAEALAAVGIGLYADDFSDFSDHRSLYGKRRCIFHCLWGRK